MTIQPVYNNVIGIEKENYTHLLNNRADKNIYHEGSGNNFRSKKNIHTDLATTYFSASKMTLNYSNKDGDSISLQIESVEYQKSMLSSRLASDSATWYEIVENINNEFKQFHRNRITDLIEYLNDKSYENQESYASKGIEGLPEYWNAENTSQRIIDFATSFYGIVESHGKEYYDMIRSAIEEGFKQAKEILGELPDAVNELANSTYELVMEKLDVWAFEQGIFKTPEAIAV